MISKLKYSKWYRAAKSYSWYILSYLIIFSLTVIKIPVLTKVLSPADIGIYSFVLSLLTYIQVIFLSWISSTSWRFIYEKERIGNANNLFYSLLPLIFLTTFLAAIGTLFLSIFISLSIIGNLLLFVGFFTILTQELAGLYLLYLQASNKIKNWAVIISAQQILSFILMLIFLYQLKLGIVSVFLSQVLINLILLLLVSSKLKKPTKNLENQLSFHTVFSYSLFTIAANLALLVLNNSDRIIINYYKGSYSLGLYSQTYSIASVGFFSFIQVFNTVFIPIYNKEIVNKRTCANGTGSINITRLYFVLLLPVCLFFCFNGKNITSVLLAKSFQGFYNIIPFVVIGNFLYGIANFYEVKMKLENNIKRGTAYLYIAAISNIVLNLLLLKNSGIIAAAITTFISYLLLAVLLIYKNKTDFVRIYTKSIVKDLSIVSFSTIAFYLTSNVLLDKVSTVLALIINVCFFLLIVVTLLRKHIFENLVYHSETK